MQKNIQIDVSKYTYKELETVYGTLGAASKLPFLSAKDKDAIKKFQDDVMEAAFALKEDGIRKSN